MYIPLTFEGALQKCLFPSSSNLNEGFFVSGSQQWKYHWFTSSANFTVDKGAIDNARIYVIGGGGGGATGNFTFTGAGGGGGGGITYTTNAILYKGTYTITVGKGGAGGSGSVSPGSNGFPSSFVGQNINLFASGGFGSLNATGGTSGNGYAGGSANGTRGGGGGGAFGTGSNASTTKAGDGGPGLSLQVSEPVANPVDNWSFGCGGGGYAAASANTRGGSCNGTVYGWGNRGTGNGTDGANYYGQGGGAGATLAGAGGSGSVIIQYPISDYCSNYFNRTGSCDCRQITFDASDPFDYYPYLSGSYFYMPCGGTSYVTGSVFAYAPISVCANSGSFYFGPSGSSATLVGQITGSNTLPQCSSGSKGYPQTCTTSDVYTSSCSSSLFTYFKPGGPGATGYAYYVGRNTGGINYAFFTGQATSASDRIGAYTCQSTIASNPSGSTSNLVRYDGAKCLVLNYTYSTAGSLVQRIFWNDCAGTPRSASFNFPGSVNFNFTASFALGSPYFTTVPAGGVQPDVTVVSVHSDYTGSGLPNCGCP